MARSPVGVAGSALGFAAGVPLWDKDQSPHPEELHALTRTSYDVLLVRLESVLLVPFAVENAVGQVEAAACLCCTL